MGDLLEKVVVSAICFAGLIALLECGGGRWGFSRFRAGLSLVLSRGWRRSYNEQEGRLYSLANTKFTIGPLISVVRGYA